MNLKKLMEKRTELKKTLDAILEKAKNEGRAMTDEENKEFERLEEEIKGIDRTLKAEERARELTVQEGNDPAGNEDGGADDKERERQEERAFEDYIRGVVTEERADTNLTAGDNGAVIPTSIANKIIQKVRDICPIYQLAEHYNVSGTLAIPYYDDSSSDITMEYATEFAELESSSGKFKSIELKGFLAGALTKISRSLINNSQFNITDFVVNRMAENIARWLEKESLNGTADKIEGISKASQVTTAAAETAITGDELIDLQEMVPDRYQPSCIWIMHKATRTAIRKLKDSDGDYILQKDMTSRWGYRLFGAEVYCSDNMPKMEAGDCLWGYVRACYQDF